MDKHIVTNFLILAEILLFLSLPIIAMQHVYKLAPQKSPTVLNEANLSHVAKFKSYEDSISYDPIDTPTSKKTDGNTNNVSPKPTEPVEKVTPAVQSVSYSIEDVEPTSTPEPTGKQPITPTPQPVDISNSPQSLTPEQITFLGNCEAGMDPTKNTGNGYYGAFQFSYATWKSMNTGYERADLAPLEVQIDAVQRLLQRSSIFTQFPACARNMQRAGLL